MENRERLTSEKGLARGDAKVTMLGRAALGKVGANCGRRDSFPNRLSISCILIGS